MTTQVAIVNYSLELIGSQTTITSLADGSPAANAAAIVYAPTVNLVLRELDPDFARAYRVLALLNNPSPFPPWLFAYQYPDDCLRVRQVRPAPGSYDPNNPHPVRASIGIVTAASGTGKAILTNEPNAGIIYTTSNVTENLWDAVFAEVIARRLANPLSMALSGRPDVAKQLLEEASQIAMTGGAVDESSMKPF